MGRAGCLLLQNKERIAQAAHGLEAISLMKFAFNTYARPDGMVGSDEGRLSVERLASAPRPHGRTPKLSGAGARSAEGINAGQ